MPELFGSAGRVTFRLADRARRLTAVRLVQEIGVTGPLDFSRAHGMWQLDLTVPDVQRMEYLFDIVDRHGIHSTITDPANPNRVAGAFGDKSVVEFDGYAAPKWLTAEEAQGNELLLQVEAADLEDTIDVLLWQPKVLEADEPAPLLVVHDGPEFARLAQFERYVAAHVESGALPPVRTALLSPGDRNAWYSANPAYARALADHVLPAVAAVAPASVRVGVGASLGALAMLHAHVSFPGRLDALFLQSGSFFTPELDPQEASFSGFAAVTRFVGQLHAGGDHGRPVPAVLTCGTAEENFANNAAMSKTLQRLGYPVRFVPVRDAHNYTAWRDALDPHLTDLVTSSERHHAA